MIPEKLKNAVRVLAVSLASLLFPTQQSLAEEPCAENQVVSVPSRPTVSNATDTTRCGVVELDLGGQRAWIGEGQRQETLLLGLRFGLTRNLDFHWQGGSYVNSVDAAAGSRGGFGENWVGLKYRFVEQTKLRPSMGVFYDMKIPSDERSNSFSTGKFDQALSLLFSKDIHPVHFDFNIFPLLAGKPSASGHDFNTGLALSCNIPLTRKLTMVAEGYGATYLNPSNPSYSSVMGGLTYMVKPRLVLDLGSDWGLTHTAPEQRVYGGITLALANVYSLLRPDR